MQVIFQYAAPLAEKGESLEWAEVAVRAAELDASRNTGTVREEALLDAMRLRSWFICRHGSRPEHVVLDKEIVLRWATDGLNLSIQKAKASATTFWADVAKAQGSADSEALSRIAKEISQLRWIKHRLNIVKVLADCGELPVDSELREWLQVRESLP
jgi:hypothetical protein